MTKKPHQAKSDPLPKGKGKDTQKAKDCEEHNEQEAVKSTRHWRSRFLDHLAQSSNVSAAAKHAGIQASRAYAARRAEPQFAREWYSALLEGYDGLELETLERLRHGIPVDGPKIDIANALRLLAMHRETVVRERARLENHTEEEILESLNTKLDNIRKIENQISSKNKDD